jgi:hypothetical protein
MSVATLPNFAPGHSGQTGAALPQPLPVAHPAHERFASAMAAALRQTGHLLSCLQLPAGSLSSEASAPRRRDPGDLRAGASNPLLFDVFVAIADGF